VASALVNTMQQVGGSIGASALSTVALTATASYLTAHQTSPLALQTAAVHDYTVAFTVSAALFALGAVLAFTLLPSRRQQAARAATTPGTVSTAAGVAGSAPGADAATGGPTRGPTPPRPPVRPPGPVLPRWTVPPRVPPPRGAACPASASTR
jgi:hypothetical protein